jgi:hypothetical protein
MLIERFFATLFPSLVACIFPFPDIAQHALWSFGQLAAPEKSGDKQALNLVNMTTVMMVAVFVIKLSSKFLVSYLKNDIAIYGLK